MSNQNQTKPFNYESIPAGYYDEVYRRRQGAQSKWHHLKFDFIKERLGAYEHHLDIGCGPGTFIGTLDQLKNSVGVDISQSQIKYAREHYASERHQFIQISEDGQLPFSPMSFDVITLIEVIEHLPVTLTKSLLFQAETLLKPNGKIIISTPNYQSFWPMLEWAVNKVAPVKYEDQHISKFTKQTLAQLFTQLSFKHYVIQTYQGFAPFTASINWKLADGLSRFENRWWASRFGLLLYSEVRKNV